MAERSEQVRPLTPASFEIKVDEGENKSTEVKTHHRRKCLIWCGSITAIFLIIAVIIIVLVFTVFKVKDPKIKMKNISIEGLDTLVRMSNLRNEVNLTIGADVSVKNPNVASFKFNNATMSLYYNGSHVGEATIPAGEARARRTLDMSVSASVMVDRLMVAPSLSSDLASGKFPISAYTRMSGKVKVINIIKKHVVLKMNCTMSFNLSTQALQDLNCKRRVSM